MEDFKDKLVKKPWGEEYLVYENEHIALWHLKIKEGQETSFHCHPSKKTGLIVIAGAAKVSFLSDDFKLFPGEKIMIRQGVFHKTKAMVGDIEVLEIETPKNKLDLVRLEDKYGRAGTGYETDYEIKSPEIAFPVYTGYKFRIGKCTASIQIIPTINKDYIKLSDVFFPEENRTYIILKGEIASIQNNVVAGPGDVLYYKSLALMLSKFQIKEDIMVLTLEHKI